MQALNDAALKGNNTELNDILNTFVKEVEKEFNCFSDELEKTFDFTSIERDIAEIYNTCLTSVLKLMIENLLTDKKFLAFLKKVGGRLGMHYVRYKKIWIRLYNGQKIQVLSPYFVKAKPKDRRKKKKKGPKGPKGRGHLGLTILGFIGLCSGNIVSEVVKMAVLCPSFKVASEVFAERGISINVKEIRRLCRELGRIGLEFRGEISMDRTEKLDGYTLVIGIDGGRLRERTRKRGRMKKDQKRKGFNTDWRAPNLFVIYLLDEEGNIIKNFRPLYDATMTKKDGIYVLVEKYLNTLDISNVGKIVFCGDGDPGIWNGVEAICKKIGINSTCIYQVLDYIHAKQNLQEIIDLIPKNLKSRKKIAKKWKDYLWQGDIQGIYKSICNVLKKKRKESGIKKWENYFKKNEKRMQYQAFKGNHIPCGSGCVESAIRRVINLRIKAPGMFWNKDMAEYFLFLRSQLLSGRWIIFMKNVTRKLFKDVINQNKNQNVIQFPRAMESGNNTLIMQA